MPDAVKLSILIVNYEGARVLPDCLRSIAERVTIDHEVIVVDNASADRSVEIVRRDFPGVRLIENTDNAGFAAGNAVAARHARGEYLLLLNNDTVLLDDLDRIVAWLDDHPRVGIAGARMLTADHDYTPSAGRFPAPARLFAVRTMQVREGPFRDGTFPPEPPAYDVDWVGGAFLLTRRTTWDEVGGLDPQYFMYVEDVDYCRAAATAGHGTVYFPSVRYVHLVGFRAERMGLQFEGFRRYHRKHSGPWTRVAASTVLTTGLAARAVVSGARYLWTRDPEQRTRAAVCWRTLLRRGTAP